MPELSTQNVILILLTFFTIVNLFRRSGIVINNNLKYHYAENLDAIEEEE